jgi:hypothetical protein
MLVRFNGTAFDATSKTMIQKSAFIRLRKSFTNIKKGRSSYTDDFQTTEHTQKAIKYKSFQKEIMKMSARNVTMKPYI